MLATAFIQSRRWGTNGVEEIYDRWHYLPQMRAAVVPFEMHFRALLAPSSQRLPVSQTSETLPDKRSNIRSVAGHASRSDNRRTRLRTLEAKAN